MTHKKNQKQKRNKPALTTKDFFHKQTETVSLSSDSPKNNTYFALSRPIDLIWSLVDIDKII